MPAFTVTLVDATGHRQRLVRDAADEKALGNQLRKEALWPVAIVPARSRGRLARLKLSSSEFVSFLHQLELQLKAGVTADVALAQLLEDAPKGKLRTMLERIHREVAHGSPIHGACRYFKRQFPAHVAAVIAAGEASACLPESLRALAGHQKGADELRRTVGRALIYPVLVVTASLGLVVFLVAGVVPKFAEILVSMHIKMPLPTAVLIATSQFVQGNRALVFGGLGALIVAVAVFVKHPKCRWVRDSLFLRTPLWGDALRCVATSRFAAHTRLLHEAGIPLLEALETGAELTGNAVLARRLLTAREGVRTGQPLYGSLPRNGAFPAFVVPAIKAGESTGQLGAALRHVEEYASGRAKELTATALALLEPAILIFLAIVVGGIVLAFLLPLLALMGGVQSR